MWVCHCRAVTDSMVRQVIEAGADNENEIGEECGAGTGCGSCHDELRRLCEESARFAAARDGAESRELVTAGA
jgi:bacterioferritin-associated ferredoxin